MTRIYKCYVAPITGAKRFKSNGDAGTYDAKCYMGGGVDRQSGIPQETPRPLCACGRILATFF